MEFNAVDPPNVKFSTEQIVAALQANAGLIYFTARALGCRPQTIYNRARRSQAVQQAIDDTRGELLDMAESGLRQRVAAGDLNAIMFVLKTLGRARGYGETQDVSHSGQVVFMRQYVGIDVDKV